MKKATIVSMKISEILELFSDLEMVPILSLVKNDSIIANAVIKNPTKVADIFTKVGTLFETILSI